MFDKLRKTFQPEIFQGNLDRDRYFEGWYFKLVDAEQKHRLALIPGVSLDRTGGTSHSFVQVIDGNSAETGYFRYDLDEFRPADDRLHVHVGPNTFSSSAIKLDLRDGDRTIQGDLQFKNLSRFPRKLFAPGVMGWYSFVPRMECYHGLVSMDHRISGTVTLDETIDFTNGRGYIEKDWGTSFPSAYLWMQSNHFETPGVSIMASIAKIPWVGRSFNGFLCTLLYDGEIRNFATYTGAKIKNLDIGQAEVRFTIQDKKYNLDIHASRKSSSSSPKEGFGLLQSPSQGAMKARIAETLTAEIDIRLAKRRPFGRPGPVIFEGVGRSAGFEIEAKTVDLT